MILGANGERLDSTIFECRGFKFDEVALAENPALMLMAVICISPNLIQEEFLNKAGVVFNDVEGKQIFPPVIEEVSDDEKKTNIINSL